MHLYVEIAAPHRWAVVGKDGIVKESGEADELDISGVTQRYSRTIGVVPGEHVLSREVSLPIANRAKAMAAIPFALEESLTSEVEDLVFAMMEWRPKGVSKLCVVEKTQLVEWRDTAAKAGIKLDALVPDYLLVPLHPQASMTIARNTDGDVVIRTASAQGVKLDPESFGIWWSELEDKHAPLAVNEKSVAKQLVEHHEGLVSEWPIGTDFVAWLDNGGGLLPANYNLLQGEFQESAEGEGGVLWRWAAAIFGLALAVKIGVDGAEYVWLSKENQRLDQEISSLYQSIFPDGGTPSSPRQAMESQIAALEIAGSGSSEFQQLLSAVAIAVPNSNAKIEEIAFRDRELLLTCSTQDFAGLNQLRQMFDQITYIQSELVSSAQRDQSTTGRFRLQQRAG